MQMTNEEIVRSYNEAANKSKQIKILADLNLVPPGVIRTVLAEAGVASVKPLKRPAQKKPEAETPGPAAEPDKSFFQRVEAILNALPEELSDKAAAQTQNLLQTLFADFLEQRLGRGGKA